MLVISKKLRSRDPDYAHLRVLRHPVFYSTIALAALVPVQLLARCSRRLCCSLPWQTSRLRRSLFALYSAATAAADNVVVAAAAAAVTS